MASASVQRILWKEYRTFRNFWICMFVLTLFLQWLVVYVHRSTNGSMLEPDGLLFIALAMTLFYCLGVGATIFNMEHEQATFEQLRAWPSGFREVWLGKTLFVFLSSITLGLAVSIATRSFWGPVPWWMCGFAVLPAIVILSLSILCSLLVRGPLPATFTAGASTFVAWVVGDWVSGFEPFGNRIGTSVVLLIYGAIGLLLFLATYFLAGRWFSDRPRMLAEQGLWSRLSRPALSRSLMVRAQLVRTAWLTVRQLGWIWLSVFVLAGLLSLLVMWQDPAQSSGFLIFFGVWPILLGATLFAGDQSQRSYRFFTERGVPEQQFWWQRQLVGLIVFAALLLLTLPPVVRFASLLRVHGESLFVVTAYLSYCVLVYALGQLLSMAMRSHLLALTFTFVGALLIAAWCFLVTWFHLPWWLAMAIPAAGLGGASYARVRDWMLEQDKVKDWISPVATLAFAGLVTVGAFYAYRVYEIPWIESGARSQSLLSDPHVDLPKNTKSTFLAALQQIDPLQIPIPDRYDGEYHSILAMRLNSVAAPPWSELPSSIPAAETQWLDENRDALQQELLPAMDHAEDLFRVGGPLDRSTDIRMKWPVYLLVASARERQAAGDLATAQGDYRSAIRICDKLRSSGGPFDCLTARQAEYLILQNLLFWAAADGQTADQLTKAIEWSREWCAKEREWSTPLTLDFQLQRESIAQMFEADASETLQSGPTGKYLFWASILPGEGRRWQRLLNVMERASKDVMQAAIVDIQDQQPITWLFSDDPQRGWRDVWPSEWNQLEEWRNSTPLLRPFLDRTIPARDLLIGNVLLENTRRATHIQLQLIEWKLRHGAYPTSKEWEQALPSLHLPFDILTGRPFVYLPTGLNRDLVEYISVLEPLGSFYADASGVPVLVSPEALRVDRQQTPIGTASWILGCVYPLPSTGSDHP